MTYTAAPTRSDALRSDIAPTPKGRFAASVWLDENTRPTETDKVTVIATYPMGRGSVSRTMTTLDLLTPSVSGIGANLSVALLDTGKVETANGVILTLTK